MISITFPDKSVKQYDEGVTGLDIARSISNSLAKEVLAITVNDTVRGLTEPIAEDTAIQLHKWDEKKAKETFWHSSAHLMAEAIEALYPGTKFGVGPSVETGFYYDIELPDGLVLHEKELPKIEKKMLQIAQQKHTFSCRSVPKNEALDYFREKNDHYKLDLIGGLADGTITFYTQGSFTDLCRGPHLPHTALIKAVKLTALAGAYWKGDENNKMMTRVYGVTFPKQAMLDEYLQMLEEAQKRDHRKLGKEMQLFTFSNEVGSGLPLWLPQGTILREQLELFLKKVQRHFGYEQVISPHIGHISLYKTSGHYEKYGEDSFRPITTPHEGEEFLLKPMNCPHHCEMYKSSQHTYKDLPVRLAEFGTVYRYEQSGELHGLTRVRGFTQDDAHIFCTPEQLKDEFAKVIDIIFIIFKALSFDDYTAQISLRDKDDHVKYIGSDENWDKAEQAIVEVCQEKELETVTEYGEAAFYGPKLDFMIKDAIGRKWQLGTIQVDYNLPERFKLEYIGHDNQKHRPVMIHRAPFGSMERFIAVLIEHTAGKFPVWLTPTQVTVLPISDKFNNYAEKVANLLNNCDIRTTFDHRNEKIGKKIRDSEVKKIPYMLIVGQKEEEANTVSVRRQGVGDEGSMNIEEFAKTLKGEITSQLAINTLLNQN